MTQKYSEYKDSGVQWLGEIPSHWERTKVSRLFKQIGSGTTPSSGDASLYADEGIPWLQSGDFNNNEINSTSKFITNKALDNYNLKLYKPGGIVIAMYGASIGKVGLLSISTTVNQACCVLSGSDHLLQKFAFYVFINEKENLVMKSKGGTQPNISQEIIKSHYIPLPPLPEQQAIVSYLDTKCSQLDKMLEGKQKQIDLLSEMKQRVIADAVTRGLNPDVKMKDSGIFWLSMIPEGWNTRRLGYILNKENRERPQNAELLVCTNKAKVVKRGDSKMGLVADSEDVYQGVHKGDLLIHGMDTWHGAIAVSEYDGMCTPVVHVCTSKENVEYISFYMRYMAMMKVFKLISNGVRQNTSDFRSWAKVATIPCPVPPISEQQAIVSYIQERTTKIDLLASKLQQEIENIKEYKQRLISDVVTGQIKVS